MLNSSNCSTPDLTHPWWVPKGRPAHIIQRLSERHGSRTRHHVRPLRDPSPLGAGPRVPWRLEVLVEFIAAAHRCAVVGETPIRRAGSLRVSSVRVVPTGAGSPRGRLVRPGRAASRAAGAVRLGRVHDSRDPRRLRLGNAHVPTARNGVPRSDRGLRLAARYGWLPGPPFARASQCPSRTRSGRFRRWLRLVACVGC